MRDTVSFSQDTFHATLLLSGLLELPVKNVRKIFSTMLSEPWQNEQAIHDTELYLEDIVPDSKRAWDDASVRFQREWRKIEKPTGRRTKAQIHAAAELKAHNDELIRTVKTCKAKYEHWVKIQALWNDTKHKMNFQ